MDKEPAQKEAANILFAQARDLAEWLESSPPDSLFREAVRQEVVRLRVLVQGLAPGKTF